MGKRSKVLLACVTLAVIASYSNVLQGEFQFDDYTSILNNPAIKDISLFSPSFVLKTLNSGNRPVTLFTFALNHAAGGMSVEGYHALNLLIHLTVVFLVFVFVRQILALPFVAGEFGGGEDLKALAVAGVFALHPLQTEAVSYIVQRAEILSSLFYLLSLLSLISFAAAGHRRHSVSFLAAGIACFILGWGTKEIIVTAPAMAVLYSFFFLEGKARRRTLAAITPFLAVAFYLGIKELLRFHGNADIGFAVRGLDQPAYFFTQLRVLMTYLRLILFPVNQNLDYDYLVYRNFSDPQVFLPALFWLAVILLSAYSLRYEGRWKWHFRIAGFGAAWFLIILAPTSSVIPVRDVIFEHRCYLALLGVLLSAIALADLAYRALRNKVRMSAHIPAALLVVLFAALAIVTHERNNVWQTKLALWTDVAAKSPNKSRAHNNLGNCYLLNGDNATALGQYLTAMRLDPENVETYYNAALTLERLGRRIEAAFYYSKFLEKAPPQYYGIMQSVREKLAELNRRAG